MRVLCVFGQHNYGDPRRGQSYEYTNFVPSLRRLGHEVELLDSWNRTKFGDFNELNAAVLRTVEKKKPDIVFSVLMHYEVWLETWEILRNVEHVTTVNWATDDSWKYSQFSRLVAPSFHAFATTYPSAYARYKADGIQNVLLTQWGASPDHMQPPIRANECTYPVSFVGTAHGSRGKIVAALRDRGIYVECFGHGWPNGPVATGDVSSIIRNSVVSLNFANASLSWDGVMPKHVNQIKARTFEVPGCGGFLLTEWAQGLDSYYKPGEEIETFRNVDDLQSKIEYYLANPHQRDRIAIGGYERTLAEHTYCGRLKELLEFALRVRQPQVGVNSGSSQWQIDWNRFERAAAHHRLTRRLSLLSRVLAGACSAAWGPARGHRAARRLVFELSWRLAGAHTYSASGWPGRMFYEAG